jgi:hypothetical protein
MDLLRKMINRPKFIACLIYYRNCKIKQISLHGCLFAIHGNNRPVPDRHLKRISEHNTFPALFRQGLRSGTP